MNYKIGMKVKIVDCLDPMEPVGTNEDMEELQGKIATIVDVLTNQHGEIYKIDIDGGDWIWSPTMLLPIALNKGNTRT